VKYWGFFTIIQQTNTYNYMGCRLIYKDVDGKPSAIYERAVEKYGLEKAEEIYIRHMLPKINTRRSVSTATLPGNSPFDVAGQDDVEINEGHTRYINQNNGESYSSITTLLEKYVVNEDPKSVAALLRGATPESGLALGLTNQAMKLLAMELSEDKLPLTRRKPQDIVDYVKLHPEALDAAKKDVQALWTAQNEGGNIIHTILRTVNEVAEEKATETNLPVDPNQTFQYIIEAQKRLESSNIWYKEGTRIPRYSTESLAKIVKPLYTYIQKRSFSEKDVNGNPQKFHLVAEKKIYTNKLKDPTSGSDGIAGTVDLLIVSEDKKTVIMVDFKTKALHKKTEFSKITGQHIKGPFATPKLGHSAENMALAQELLYSTVLRVDPRYNTIVTDLISLVIPVNYTTKGFKQEIGDNEYEGVSIGEVDPITPDKVTEVGNKTQAIIKFYTTPIDPNVRDVFDEYREKGIAGITESWSGETEDGNPQATYSKWHRESFIKKRMNTFQTNPDGTKFVYSFDGTKLDITGKTDDQIKTMLSEKYDQLKYAQENLPSDVVDYFNAKGKGREPKTMYGKSNAISILLRGISHETHTLELAQNYLPELSGIGPDVLVAVNRKTKAITLLSAIITRNSPVKFPGDGSKNKRSSILGKFVTDQQLQSSLLPDKLMHTPTVHDYINMKLGLAAMYINKHYGGNANIEKMQTVSMFGGNSTEYTTTTPDAEIGKLKAFRRYAGIEFPQEYSDLLDSTKKISTAGNTLKDLIAMIETNTDPLGDTKQFLDVKKELVDSYNAWHTDKLQGWELKKALGNYMEAVALGLNKRMTQDEIQSDPQFRFVAKTLLEYCNFDLNVQQWAADRNSVAAMNGAVSSGDPYMIRFHVEQNSASQRVRQEMNDFMKEHKRLYKAVFKEKSVDIYGNTTKAFDNLWVNDGNQANAMTFKKDNDPSLTAAEKAYVKFWNDEMIDVLVHASPRNKVAGILDGTYWQRGTVPILKARPELLNVKTLTSWENLREVLGDKFKAMRKKTVGTVDKSFLEFEFPTQFDNQATDTGVGHSDRRRKALGLQDPNSPTELDLSKIERNPIAILNMARLESAEKSNNRILLQLVVAAQTSVSAAGVASRTGMTKEMIEVWKEMMIFTRYKDEPLAPYVDTVNRMSSEILFAFSIRQAMIELSTGTLQTASALMANTMQNAYASWFGREDMKGRYNWNDFVWGMNAWAKWDPKINQMVYDNGMLVADANDMRNAEFYGGNKVDLFKSEVAFAANRLFFNSAITHTFLAQMRHLGIDKAYTRKGDNWVYDETKDPRFFVYDPDNGIGDVAPSTDDELRRHSLWKATRESLASQGGLDPATKRMTTPLTGDQRAEIKLYATRMVGSFSSDAAVVGEFYSIQRVMSRFKRYGYQKIANYYTPTVKDNPIYGKFRQAKNEEGEWETEWVPQDFQGIIQTLGHVVKEISMLRGVSMVKNLNQYQLENLTKLMSDLLLFILMMTFAIPFLANVQDEVNEETGKITSVTGDFGKSQLGTSALRAAVNAASDLMFIYSLPSMAESMAPGFQVMGGGLLKVGQALDAVIKGDTKKAEEKALAAATTSGLIRTGTSVLEIFKGFGE